LARVVVAGDLSLTGIIGRNGSTYDFAGTFSSGSALATIEATLDAWEQWLRDNPRPLPNDALEDLTDGTTEPPTGVDPPAIDPPAPRVDPTPDTPVEYPTIDPVPIGKLPFWIGDQVELLPELPGLIDRPVNKHWIFGDPTNWPRLDRIDSPPLIFVDDGPQRYSVGATLDNSMFYTTSNGFGPQNRGQFAPTPEPSSWLLALLAAALLSVMAPRRARRPR